MAGCSNKDNPASPPEGGGAGSTSLIGLFVGAGDGGKLSITIASASLARGLRTASLGAEVVSATGTLDPDGAGATIPLTGTYNTTTDSLNVSGSGYVLQGLLEPTGAIVGEYTGPSGPGAFGTAVGAASAAKVFCGSFENAGLTILGRWNLTVSGDNVGGFGAADVGGITQIFGFSGSATGTSNPRQVMLAGYIDTDSLSATGTWDTTNDQVQGTWNRFVSGTTSPVDNGTWVGGLCDATNPTSYQGTWHLYHTPTVRGSLCGTGDPIGVEIDNGTITVHSSGNFTVVDGGGGDPLPGTVNLATGAWTITLSGDPPGTGACPGGSAMGNVSSYSSGTGTYSQGGDMGTVRITR